MRKSISRRARCSASRLARDFSRDRATSRSLVRNSIIGVSVSQPDRPVTPDQVFGSDRGFGSSLLGLSLLNPAHEAPPHSRPNALPELRSENRSHAQRTQAVAKGC